MTRNTIAVHEQRKLLLYAWLLNFQFTTRHILAEHFHAQQPSISRFIASLIKKGLVRETYSPVTREKLLYLTTLGTTDAEILTGHSFRSFAPKNIAHTTVVHELSVQIGLLRRSPNRNEFLSHTELTNRFTNSKKIPDAIYMSGKNQIALEIELTQKSKPRIYRSFLNHVDSIKEKLYGHIEYVFISNRVKTYYENLFYSGEWPRMVFNDRLRRYVETGEVFIAADYPQLSERFKFVLEDLYHPSF